MQEKTQELIEKIPLKAKDNVARVLHQCTHIDAYESEDPAFLAEYHVTFDFAVFFKGLAKLTNQIKQDKKVDIGIETLLILFQGWGLEFEPEDAFIIYHLRELGKFKIKDTKLKAQLDKAWKAHPDYALNDQEYAHTIKVLRRMGFLEYRKGNLTLSPTLDFVYRE